MRKVDTKVDARAVMSVDAKAAMWADEMAAQKVFLLAGNLVV